MNRIRKGLLMCLLGVLVAAAGSGCSSDNPLEPSSGPTSSSSSLSQDVLLTQSSDPFQVAGRVESIDWEARQLTLIGYGYIITASEDCDIAVIQQGAEIRITFGGIKVGDSLLVCGRPPEKGEVLAHRIRVFGESACTSWDVEFHGTITSIDYAAGTFAVAERAETILTDENTVIWTRVQRHSHRNGLAKGGDPRTRDPKENQVRFMAVYDTTVSFTDLKVGDSVVVKANIVDEGTLLAVKINLASECFVQCVEFTDRLALIDIDARMVAFETESWTGFVCPNALLADADGTPLTLADFSPSALVSVRGYPVAEDTLKICEMIMQ